MDSKKTISFMQSLCMGVIEEKAILPFPKLSASESETLKGVISTVEPWLKPHEGDFRKWDRQGELPTAFIDEIKQLGLFSLMVPEEFGGLGLSTTGYSRMLQELARFDGSIAITVGAHTSIGMKGLILFGTPAQKAKYYPKLASGEMIAAFCLTEPGAGSDAASIKTKAVRDGDDWIITGEKLWITNGGIGSFFTVFARTDGPEGQITAFIVTRDMAGVTNGPHEDKMGLRASSTTTLNLDRVRVPKDHVLGEVGKGFKVAMNILNSGRTGLGGGSIGAMKKLIAACTAQANQRVQFGKKIADYGLIKQKIGNMIVDCYAAEAVVTMVSHFIDSGVQDYSIEAAISKVFATEALWRTADEALQVAAGNGYMCEFPYERALRDCRINRIFEGTNDILRLFIALTAMNEVSKQLKELGESLEGVFHDPIKGFGLMSEFAKKKVNQATGIGGAKNKFSQLHPALESHAGLFEETVRSLSAAADRILLKHGKHIIDKQFATKRLADIMIDLFVLACMLSRVSTEVRERGEESCTEELEILSAYSGRVRRQVQANFEGIDDNDDEAIKSIADHALARESYGWDTV